MQGITRLACSRNSARFLVERRLLYSTPRITRSELASPSTVLKARALNNAARRNIYTPGSRLPASLSTFQARAYSSSSDVTEDSERPGLFYHPIGNQTFALSFLSEKPTSPDSATVIGLIPEDQGLDAFEENQAFVDLLHDTVKAALIAGIDQDLANDAKQRQEGWLHVRDMRNFPENGRVGDADDILGSVLVQDGKIDGETYERMPSYRTCTTDGPLKLSPSLHEELLDTLKKTHKKESKAKA